MTEYSMLKFFDYEHLPANLRDVAQPFHDLAHQLAEQNLPSAESTAGLRKLLESKDCFVRANL
jgi:hypothetical protein